MNIAIKTNVSPADVYGWDVDVFIKIYNSFVRQSDDQGTPDLQKPKKEVRRKVTPATSTGGWF